MSFVRQSKFRHVFGQATKNEKCYNGLKTEGTGDTNAAVSGKFIAMIKTSKIFIIPLERTGRQEENQIPYIDCKTRVNDVQWSPFNDNILASCHESGGIYIWQIPDGGLKDNMSDELLAIDDHHRRKLTCVQWHPSAKNIIAVSGADNYVTIWNVTDQDTASEPVTEIQDVGDMPVNVAWNTDGSVLGITAKSGKQMSLLLANPRTGEILKKKEGIYNGMKAAKLCFLNNGNVLTVGADRSASRSIFIWSTNGDEIEEAVELELDDGSGVLNVYYDVDLNILYTFAKGESVVKYYEIDEKNSEIYYLSAFSTSVSQKGGNFMPKRCVDTSATEIARFYKFQPAKCEPVSFIVPRKSDHFQKDIYPPCPSHEEALQAEEWIEGIDKSPKKMEFGANNVTTKKEARAPSKSAPKKSAASKAAPTKVQEVAVSAPSDGSDLAELLEDMKKVKATVRKLNKRVTKLEELLEQQGVDAKEEEEEE